MPEFINVPQDLTLVGDQELHDYEVRVLAEFDRIYAQSELSPEDLQHLDAYAGSIDRIRAEKAARDARDQQSAAQARAKNVEVKETLHARVHGRSGEGGATASDDERYEAIAAAAARGTAAALVAAAGDGGGGFNLAKRATASLATARRHAPATTSPRDRLAVTASVDIPGVATGSELTTLDAVVDAFQKRARALPVSDSGRSDAGPRVVTIRNQFDHTIDDRTSPAQVEELIKGLVSREKTESLVAGGGWCAPSEIRYDFFNIACEDGAIDLPTFGVSRGGIRYPTSPSLADTTPTGVFGGFSTAFATTSNPWLWTETDDTAATTGSPTKPCVRIPCPTFSERRLECYGLCLTAGNLTDDAYPEASANFLRLLMSAHSHAMNSRTLATMVSLSSAVITGTGMSTGTDPVFNQVVGAVNLASTDYRARYGMCDDDVLEVVIPQWVSHAIVSDLAWRTSADGLLAVTRAQIDGYFAARNVRVQWVNDWQVRGSGQFGAATAMVDWPTTVDVMVYAAGTFIRGNGLTLDLGVVRDSTLNATNDHTAAWSEECHLVALVGHASRLYRIAFNVNGAAAPALAAVGNQL